MIGLVTFDRRGTEHPGRVRPEGGEAELGYMFLPEAWACGYAAEACAAALGWIAGALPGEPVVLTTRPPTTARCASRQSWGSPRWSGSRSTPPSNGLAYGLGPGCPAELMGDGAADPTRRSPASRCTGSYLAERLSSSSDGKLNPITNYPRQMSASSCSKTGMHLVDATVIGHVYQADLLLPSARLCVTLRS
jgi:hypothetical protein